MRLATLPLLRPDLLAARERRRLLRLPARADFRREVVAVRIPRWPTSGHEPAAFEIYLGGYGGTSYGTWWTGNEIIYESFAPSYRGLEQTRFSPSAAQWRRFWHAIGQLTVWEWAPRYEPAERFEPQAVVRDGVHWSLTLEYAGRRVESSGDSAGPGPADLDESVIFARFLDALSRLLGGRPFS